MPSLSDEWTRWDDPKSDPIKDMQDTIKRIEQATRKPRHDCSIDGHIVQFQNPRCVMCWKLVD